MRWFERLPEIDFVFDGWRRQAYWAAVLSLGITIGLRIGHPNVQLLPYGIAEMALSPAEAQMLAQLSLLVTVGLIVLVAGREAFVAEQE
jgi:hypothetical protein